MSPKFRIISFNVDVPESTGPIKLNGLIPITLTKFNYNKDNQSLNLAGSIEIPKVKSCIDSEYIKLDITSLAYNLSDKSITEFEMGIEKASGRLFGGAFYIYDFVADYDLENWEVLGKAAIDLDSVCRPNPTVEAITIPHFRVAYDEEAHGGYYFELAGVNVQKTLTLGNFLTIDIYEISLLHNDETSEYSLLIHSDVKFDLSFVKATMDDIVVTQSGRFYTRGVKVFIPQANLMGSLSFGQHSNGGINWSDVSGWVKGNVPILGYVELEMAIQETGWQVGGTVKNTNIFCVEIPEAYVFMKHDEVEDNIIFAFNSDNVTITPDLLENGSFAFLLDTAGFLYFKGEGDLIALGYGFDFSFIMGKTVLGATLSTGVAIPVVPGIIDISKLGGFLFVSWGKDPQMGIGLSADARIIQLVTIGGIIAVGKNFRLNDSGIGFKNAYVTTPKRLNGLYLYANMNGVPSVNLLAVAEDDLPAGINPKRFSSKSRIAQKHLKIDVGIAWFAVGYKLRLKMALLLNARPAGILLGAFGHFHAYAEAGVKIKLWVLAFSIDLRFEFDALMDSGLKCGAWSAEGVWNLHRCCY